MRRDRVPPGEKLYKHDCSTTRWGEPQTSQPQLDRGWGPGHFLISCHTEEGGGNIPVHTSAALTDSRLPKNRPGFLGLGLRAACWETGGWEAQALRPGPAAYSQGLASRLSHHGAPLGPSGKNVALWPPTFCSLSTKGCGWRPPPPLASFLR